MDLEEHVIPQHVLRHGGVIKVLIDVEVVRHLLEGEEVRAEGNKANRFNVTVKWSCTEPKLLPNQLGKCSTSTVLQCPIYCPC